MTAFDLVTEPWIPVVDSDGTPREVGLRDALVNSHRWRGFGEVSPLTEVALLRLLLAVVHRALRGPRSVDEAVELLERGQFDSEMIDDYLSRWQDRLDLFHERHPFLQVPDMPGERPLPWTKLVHERASGNNPTLFDHTTDDNPPPATPAEAARALVTHLTFVPGGLIRRYDAPSGAGAPLATAAAFMPQGTTLFETLVLHLVPYDAEGDEPAWEREPYRLGDLKGGGLQAPLTGRTRIYTWCSRAIKLLPEGDGRVLYIDYGPGVTPGERLELDPMCGYWAADGRLEPARLERDRAFWRDLYAVLPATGRPQRLQVLEHATQVLYEVGRPGILFPLDVVGQVTKRADILEIRRESYPLSPRTLEPERQEAIRHAVDRAAELGDVLEDAMRAAGRVLIAPANSKPDRKRLQQLVNSLPGSAAYWSALYTDFPSFLELLATDRMESAYQYWVTRLRRAAWEAWRTVATALGLAAVHAKAIAEGERVLGRGMSEVLR